jgi:non-ribosomal peptide synthetase component F
MQYHEFAIEQRKLDLKMKEAGSSDPHIAWWQAKLSDMPTLSTLPNDNLRQSVQCAPGHLVILRLDAAVASRISDVCASVKATPLSGFIACFVAAITYRSQQSDFVMALPFVMRPFDDAVGYFSNDVLLCLKGLRELSLREAIQLVHNESMEALSHGAVPYNRIVQSASNAEHSCDKRTLYQTMVQLLDASLLPSALTPYLESIDRLVTPVPEQLHPRPMAEMDMKLDFFGPKQGTGDYIGFLQADSALFKPDTIATFCADLLQLISDASLSPDTLNLC